MDETSNSERKVFYPIIYTTNVKVSCWQRFPGTSASINACKCFFMSLLIQACKFHFPWFENNSDISAVLRKMQIKNDHYVLSSSESKICSFLVIFALLLRVEKFATQSLSPLARYVPFKIFVSWQNVLLWKLNWNEPCLFFFFYISVRLSVHTNIYYGIMILAPWQLL